MDNRQKHRRLVRRRAFVFIIMTVISAALILGIFFLCLFINIKSASIKALFEDDYTYRIGTEATEIKRRRRFGYEKSFIERDGQLYLNFTYISNTCAFSVTGDNRQIRYLLRNENEDFVTFDLSSTSAYVSGHPVNMPAPSFLDESGNLFVPCSFVDTYFDGISVAVDEENDHLIIVTLDTEGEYSLTLHNQELCEPIDPDSAPNAPTEPQSDEAGEN